MLIFIGLHEGKITLRPESGPARSFAKEAHTAIGNYLAKRPGWYFTCSSSVNHPKEFGFAKNFDINRVMSKAVEHAHRKLAVPVKPGPVNKAANAVEEAAKSYTHGYPVPLLFRKSGRDGKDVLLTFKDPSDLETFLAGLRYGSNLSRLNNG